MKKITLFIALAGLISLASCKKELTCTCTTTNTDVNGVARTGQPYVTKYKKIKKGTAKDNCLSTMSESTETYTDAGLTISATTRSETKCDLK